MTEHTQGPWVIDPYSSTHIVGAGGRHVASTGGYSTNTDNGEHHDEDDANALLIAAAPELLAVLVRETERCGFAEHDDGTSSCYVHAPNEDGNGCSIRTAIAKARE